MNLFEITNEHQCILDEIFHSTGSANKIGYVKKSAKLLTNSIMTSQPHSIMERVENSFMHLQPASCNLSHDASNDGSMMVL